MSRDGGDKPCAHSYVPKIRIHARLSQPGNDARDGWFLLHPGHAGADRPETLVELLNSPREVIPFIEAGDSTVLLLTRGNMDWVLLDRGTDIGLVYPPGAPVTIEQRVELRLIDESRIHAVLQWHSPNGHIRLSDHMNGSGTFIVAETKSGTMLINKSRVRETRLAESTARPVVRGQ